MGSLDEEIKKKILVYLMRQGIGILVLIAISCAMSYAGWYGLTVLIPKQIESNQTIIREINSSYEARFKELNLQHKQDLDTVIKAFQESQIRHEKLITELLERHKS